MSDLPVGQTIALFEEQVTIEKTRSVSDRVRVSTTVEEVPVLIEEVLDREELIVDRVQVERAVTEAPAPRQEGDTLVVSVVEERLVIEKRLFVVEELRVTRIRNTQHVAIPETVRTMRAKIEHALARDLRGMMPASGLELKPPGWSDSAHQ